MSVDSTLAPIRASFRAITRAVAPASSGLDEAGWRRAEEIVDDALSARPTSVRRQVVLFVRAVGMLSWVRHGRSLGTLDPDRMRRFLRSLERSPLLLVRKGFWGIRTLAFMGYYGQSEVRADLGYRANPGGWESRGGGQGPWQDRAGAGGPEHDAPGDSHA
ncbi:MAG: hypothetical protein P8170_19060 [Gemmatimonadota bacterium]|jgi:mRNA-degrading endonuclease toxin of MazEF toxin-antitoxin module